MRSFPSGFRLRFPAHLFLGLAILTQMASCGGDHGGAKAEEAAADTSVPVEAVPVSRRSISASYSGTATLEAMLLNRPMVVAYRISPLSYALVKLFRLIHVQYMALPNLLADERLVPEFVQGQVEPAILGAALLELLEKPENRQRLAGRFHELGDRLRHAASERAADTVLAMLKRS